MYNESSNTPLLEIIDMYDVTYHNGYEVTTTRINADVFESYQDDDVSFFTLDEEGCQECVFFVSKSRLVSISKVDGEGDSEIQVPSK